MDANKKGSERCPLIRKGKHRVLAFVFFLIYFAVRWGGLIQRERIITI